MLGNVTWCCISTTKMLLLHDAVYYHEQRFATESTVVVVGQVFSILVQCLNISNSGTVFDIRNSGTTMANFGSNSITIFDFRNSTILNISNWGTISAFKKVTIISGFRNNTRLWDTWAISSMNIYVYVHIILQCPILPLPKTIMNCCQTNTTR